MELKPLDIELQELAKNDWEKFVSLVGKDAIISAKICILRSENKSYGEISVRLEVHRQTVASHVKRSCDCK